MGECLCHPRLVGLWSTVSMVVQCLVQVCLVCIQQAVLFLTSEDCDITLPWVPSHSGRGDDIAHAAAKMALAEINTTPLPLPFSTATRLISHTCSSAWDVLTPYTQPHWANTTPKVKRPLLYTAPTFAHSLG